MDRSLPHEGHWADFGCGIARAHLEGLCHHEMSSDHIVWSEQTQKLMLVGWSHGERFPLPEELDMARRDLTVLAHSIGRVELAAFRAGYVYRLGPLGEWLFRGLNGSEGITVDVPAPEAWMRQWPPPAPELALDRISRIGAADESENLTRIGMNYRRVADRVAAKRAFLLCALAASGSGDHSLLGGAFSNVATIYADEKRFIRGYGYAAFGAIQMDVPRESVMWPQLASFVNLFRLQLHPEMERRIVALLSVACSPWDFTWRVDDVEIEAALGQSS
jgi:hypothetical protein